jgi:large subunit ribosomal protein L18
MRILNTSRLRRLKIMATGARYNVKFRRVRAGKTDYRARKHMLYSRKPRLVIRKSLKHTSIQVIVLGEAGDKTLVSASTADLAKYGYTGATGNSTAAYLAGLLLGYRAKKNAGRVFAALKGAVDAGMDIPHNPEIFPPEDKITGKEIDEFMNTKISEQFEAVKQKIQGELGE